MSESVSFDSLDDLQAALARLTGPQLMKVGERAGVKIALELEHRLSNKPGPSNQPVKWASKKQRAWYFAARRKAGLDLKYKRNSDPWSQKSSVSWGIVGRRSGETVLGNPATYAPYIYSHEHQTEQHKATGWMTDKKAADAVFREGLVARHVMAEVHSLVKDAFRGLT